MLDQRVREVSSVRVGILGLGYVGLPLAVRLAETGFTVVGIDINDAVIRQIGEGKSTVEGLTDERIQGVLGGQLTLAALPADPDDLEPSAELLGIDIFVMCVPTPLRSRHGWDPDLRYIQKASGILQRICAAERDAEQLPTERLIILESTTYPGTTREIFPPLLDEFGKLWCLAYSPERTDPGRVMGDPYDIPRVVGGVDEKSLALACTFYQSIYTTVVPVSSLEAAEMTKLVENTFRFVSIAFANEMARLAKALDLNVWEVLGKAMTKPFGLDLCFPGLIGGHCVPIDPHYLAYTMRTHREPTAFIDLAEKIHQETRRDAIGLVHGLLNRRNQPVAGSRIIFFGISYKANIGDIRESAALQIMKDLYSAGATVSYWDPVRARSSVRPKPQLEFEKHDRDAMHPDALEHLKPWRDTFIFEPEELGRSWEDVRSKVLSDEVSCIVLATAHNEFRSTYAEILASNRRPAIADLCNAIEPWLREDVTQNPGDPDAAERYRRATHEDYALLGLAQQSKLPHKEEQPAGVVLS